MEIKQLKLEQIIPYENNPRKKNDINKVADSIKEFGWQQPIVVDKNNVIIAGHGRYEAAKRLNLETAPCVIADISDAKAKAFRIVDNKTNQYSEWDFDLLSKEFNSLMNEDYNLDNLGFENTELDKVFNYNAPDFAEPEQPFNGLIGESDASIPQSTVRMIQLFLTVDTETEFKEGIDLLRKKYNTDNLTDTVYRAVLNEKDNLQS
tara:strand:- start:2094 stop:2711 length:618 start_codon:yes stop_codon:yes gene_type:complete